MNVHRTFPVQLEHSHPWANEWLPSLVGRTISGSIECASAANATPAWGMGTVTEAYRVDGVTILIVEVATP